MNVEPIAEIIDSAAAELRHKANVLETFSRFMRKEKDVSYACEALNVLRGVFDNIRIDLIVSRSITAVKGSK